ncbi:MAG: hypothetical protein JKY75_07675, partial [Erythrobacter sp.]|nr:hypothetical protein [Erythrobacter sp.]
VNTNQLTTWTLVGGATTTISQGEAVTFTGSGATSVTQGGTDNRTITISSTDNNTSLLSGGTCSGNLTVTGNLTVSGDTVTQNVSQILVEDDSIDLAHNVTNDTTDQGITFNMNTASRERVLGFEANTQRCIVAKGISGGTLVNTMGFLATVQEHANTAPTSSNAGTGIGSFWCVADTDYVYVRVE